MSAFLIRNNRFMIRRILLLCFFVTTIFGSAVAQYFPQDKDTISNHSFNKSKLFVGGNVGLSFGDITYLNLSPSIGYRFSSLLAAGVQINGQYESIRYKDQSNNLYQKDKYGLVGVGVFGRVYPIPQLFIHLQPEMNFIFGKSKYYDGTPDQKFREHVPSFLAGLGYSQSISENSAFTLMILYDLLQRTNSPYGNKPIFRAGVDLGL